MVSIKKLTLYATTYFLAMTGQTATIQTPAGFTFKDGSTVRKLDIKENTGEVLYEVKKAPFKQQIKIYRGYYLLGIIYGSIRCIGCVVGLDW
ncbi:hypothetical protein C7M44_01395 [Pediococcus pentosaceus]|nr:hypothetical protein C7M44_01395 [Pediococcus pentosaceus]